MSNCSICGVQLDQPGRVETSDCGGDCLGCMAEAGDPDAGRALHKEVKHLRSALGVLLEEVEKLNTALLEIQNILETHPLRIDSPSVDWVYKRARDCVQKGT